MNHPNTLSRTVPFSVSIHARQRLRERFPGLERQAVALCRGFYRRHADFLGKARYVYRSGNLMAIMASGTLVTVFPRRKGGGLAA